MGQASHAGGAPHMGINALYAANVALTAINALRETFREDDTIRVHPIITHGGVQVNVIPADVRVEMYVRGKTVEAIMDAHTKVDRALQAGAVGPRAQGGNENPPRHPPPFNKTEKAKNFKANPHPLVGEADYTTHRAPNG